MHERKTIGILGGMGPAATSELFSRIINNTPAKTDQEHISIVVVNDPTIPDRTKYILGEGTNPIPYLIKNINKLTQIGVDLIIIPCMTAHSFIHDLQKYSSIPILNAVELVENYLTEYYPNLQKVGLLATDGSIKSGVFQKYLTKKICIPEAKEQKSLIEIIYGENGIKAGNASEKQVNGIKRVVNHLKDSGIQAVIAGCTELSLVMDEENMSMPVIDPMMLLAEHVIKLSLNKWRTTLK